MSLESTTQELRAKVGEDSGLGATVKFVFEDGSVIFLDGASTPNRVSNEDREADCTIGLTLADFESIRAGEMDAMTAFMMGKLKVQGDMSIATRLSSLL